MSAVLHDTPEAIAITDKAAAELFAHECELGYQKYKSDYFDDMLQTLRVIANQSIGHDWTAEQAIAFVKSEAKAAISKVTGGLSAHAPEEKFKGVLKEIIKIEGIA